MLVAVLVLVPFLGKAFTIDDTLFLRQAEQVLRDPLHPTAFSVVWSELRVPVRMSAIMPSGPLQAYALAPAVRAGGNEVLAHLVLLAFALLGLWSTVALALRLGAGPGEATVAGLFAATAPAFLGMAGTAMPDVPAMALGAAGIERLAAWHAGRRGRDALLAVLGLALAALARPHALLLLVPGALLAPALSGRSREALRPHAWLPLASVPVAVLLALAATRDPEPGAGTAASAGLAFGSGAYLASNLVAFAAHWVLAFPLGIGWTALRPRKVAPPALLASALALALLFQAGHARWWWAAPIAGLGAGVLWDVAREARARRGAWTLLAPWLLLPLPLVVYIHLPAKFLLLSAPAAALLLARVLREVPRPRARWTAVPVLLAAALLGLLVLRADAAFAGLGRRAAAELIAPEVAAERRVWFAGHWGFQWYAERAGARPVTATPPLPARGDRMVAGERLPGLVLRRPEGRELLGSVAADAPGGRVMDERVGAGFYSNRWGYLPWAWSTRELERFELWEVH